MDFFDRTVSLLSKALDLRSARHEILAANVANADTPGYVAVDLVFEEELRKAAPSQRGTGVTKTHPKHFPQVVSPGAVPGRIEPSETITMGNDRNTVNVEQEMVKLAENSLVYEASVQMLIKKLRGLKEAIREGR